MREVGKKRDREREIERERERERERDNNFIISMICFEKYVYA